MEIIRRFGGYFSETGGLSLPGAVNRYFRFKNHFCPWIGLQTEYLKRLLAPRRAGCDDIACELAARLEVPVHLSSDFAHLFRCRSNDAELSSWVRQGYLAYRPITQTVALPSADALQAFRRALKSVSW